MGEQAVDVEERYLTMIYTCDTEEQKLYILCCWDVG